MHSETEFTSRPSRLECLPATLKTHNLSNRKRSTILRLRVYEELSSISTSKNRLQIPSFCHDRYYAIWLSLKNLSLGRLWTTSPGNLQRRTHISSAALMDHLCGLQIQISVVFGNHALCQQMVWFTSLPAGNHRQFAHRITCFTARVIGYHEPAWMFLDFFWEVSTSASKLRPRVVIRADSGLLPAVVFFQKTNSNG